MANIEVGLLGIVATLLLISIRVQIGVALGIVAFFGIASLTNFNAAWGIVTSIPRNYIAQWSLSAVPMFLLMGFIAARGGLTAGIFNSARILLGRVPGGLASATVVASALFASASGSSVATAAAFSRIAIPEMLKSGYKPSLAAGSVAAAGTLGSLIPPSILMIFYGLFTDTSIGAVFIAGVIPGILTAVVYIVMITTRAKLNPNLAPLRIQRSSKEELWASLKQVWPLPTLIVGVLGGIFAGVFSATEAGAIGAALAVVIAVARRSLTWRAFWSASMAAAEGTSTVFIIVIGATMFSVFMGLSTIPNALGALITDNLHSQIAVIIGIAILYLIMGCFVDSLSIMVLTIPILLPTLRALDVDMIWFGIIVIKLLEIGMITPPVGLNCFVIAGSMGSKIKLSEVFRGAAWFVLADFVTLTLLIAFPVISIFLPMTMMK